MYDIAIVGTGPAGISAAITAKIRNKSIILFGSRTLSDKMRKAHLIENYPGFYHVTGEQLADNLKNHLEKMGIEITEKRIGAVYTFDDHFSLSAGQDFIDAKTVIIAGGIVNGKPIKGEEEFLGRGVSYCATCDGFLYKGKKVAVIGDSEDAPAEAEFLAEICSEVLYFPVGKNVPKDAANIKVMEEKPSEIKGGMKADTLITNAGEYKADCIFVLRDAVSPGNLVPGIELDGPHIKVNLQMETNLPGLFACGDIAGTPYQYIKAAGQGNTAALSAVRYLGKKQ
ncbi:MAG: NAD(P)/FAD-dependent oxidoreductase [Lachnospiraceae bacterium]|nr:NAD(P)/FAD-dependent oxidoreductase [Lachnospiraceae bacterium]